MRQQRQGALGVRWRQPGARRMRHPQRRGALGARWRPPAATSASCGMDGRDRGVLQRTTCDGGGETAAGRGGVSRSDARARAASADGANGELGGRHGRAPRPESPTSHRGLWRPRAGDGVRARHMRQQRRGTLDIGRSPQLVRQTRTEGNRRRRRQATLPGRGPAEDKGRNSAPAEVLWRTTAVTTIRTAMVAATTPDAPTEAA